MTTTTTTHYNKQPLTIAFSLPPPPTPIIPQQSSHDAPPSPTLPRYSARSTSGITATRHRDIAEGYSTLPIPRSVLASSPPINSIIPGLLWRLLLSRAASLRSKIYSVDNKAQNTIHFNNSNFPLRQWHLSNKQTNFLSLPPFSILALPLKKSLLSLKPN